MKKYYCQLITLLTAVMLLISFTSAAEAQNLERVYPVPIDVSGSAGANPATIHYTNGDMGGGTSATRISSSNTMELYSRHRLYVQNEEGQYVDYELTAVFRTNFEDYSQMPILENSSFHNFSAANGGFFELWFEDGSGEPALSRTPSGFNDGVLVASGTIQPRTGSGYVNEDTSTGSRQGVAAGIMMDITYVNKDYFFEGFDAAEFSIFSISDQRNWDPVPEFALEPGGAAPVLVADLFTLNWFPDGGMLFWNDPNDDYPVDLDADNDGVKDELDSCPDTTAGQSVDGSGCSREQFCSSFSSRRSCRRADWMDDSSLRRPGDCQWVRNQAPQCQAL